LPGCCVKKLNQSLIKFYPGIPDIGGQETCFLPVKKKKRRQADRETPVMAQSSGINRKKQLKVTDRKISPA
jgi:hypothetical protein